MSMNTISNYEQSYFGSNNKVNRNGIDVEKIVPGGLSDEEIILLSGAPSNHNVKLFFYDDAYWNSHPDGDLAREGLYFEVTGPYIKSNEKHLVGIVNGINCGPCIYIKDIFFDKGKAPKGLACTMIKRMVRCATDLGFFLIELYAAGGRLHPGIPNHPDKRYGGYYAWPKYGFDMPVDVYNKELIKHFPYHPSGLMNCKNIQQILDLEYGKDYWKMAGAGNVMTFTIKSNTCEKRLLEALKEYP